MNLKLPEEPYFAAEVRHAVITDGVSRIVMSAHGKGADLHPRERLPNRLKGSRADPFLPRRVERRYFASRCSGRVSVIKNDWLVLP